MISKRHMKMLLDVRDGLDALDIFVEEVTGGGVIGRSKGLSHTLCKVNGIIEELSTAENSNKVEIMDDKEHVCFWQSR